MSKHLLQLCPICNAVLVGSLAEHLAFMADRRERYGAFWGLAKRKTYTVVDAATAPLIAYTKAEYYHDDEEEATE